MHTCLLVGRDGRIFSSDEREDAVDAVVQVRMSTMTTRIATGAR